MLSSEAVHRKSQAVMNLLFSLEAYQKSNTILAYVSYQQEVETHWLIEQSIQNHKAVYVPKVYEKEIQFHRITSLSELKTGTMGILEPDNDCICDLQEGFMIMPGLAFDRNFNRLGYGGGFYDRFLATRSSITKAAICFDFQLLDALETEPHDIKTDIIICESEIIKNKTQLD
jgi:5-formyltetrahydrofolate cyclo-ligase